MMKYYAKLNILFEKFRKTHGKNISFFWQTLGKHAWRYLMRKPVKTALLCQFLLGLVLTLIIALSTGKDGILPKDFNALSGVPSAFLFCFGIILLLVPQVLPYRFVHCFSVMGLEAMRFVLSGAALLIGVLSGMGVTFAFFSQPNGIYICLIGIAMMLLLSIYCLACLSLPKTFKKVDTKPGRKGWQLAILCIVVAVAFKTLLMK